MGPASGPRAAPGQAHSHSAGPDAGRIVLNGNHVPPSSAQGPNVGSGAGNGYSFGAAGAAMRGDSEDVKFRRASPSMPLSATAPTQSAGSMEAAARQFELQHRAEHERKRDSSGSETSSNPPQLVLPTSGSSSSLADGEAEPKEMSSSVPHHSNQMLHKCESCAKVYRHPSCLVKHRWEHTMYWKEASKFLMSKHQQVQLLEAAAILVGMDTNARSLPEEKALWPAAVSPPSSGLLGCDQVNFDKLMAAKHRSRRSPSGEVPSSAAFGTSAPAHSMHKMPDDVFHKHQHPSTASRYSASRHDTSDAMDDDDAAAAADDSGELDIHARDDNYGMNSGGDVMAEMDMEADE